MIRLFALAVVLGLQGCANMYRSGGDYYVFLEEGQKCFVTSNYRISTIQKPGSLKVQAESFKLRGSYLEDKFWQK